MHAYAEQRQINGGFASSAAWAYRAMHESTEWIANAIGLPLILWDELISADPARIKQILDRAEMPGVDCSHAAEIIVETRREEPRRNLEGWSTE